MERDATWRGARLFVFRFMEEDGRRWKPMDGEADATRRGVTALDKVVYYSLYHKLPEIKKI